ncbi:putative transmembrane protein, partial [Toxoplasma gondii MAS]
MRLRFSLLFSVLLPFLLPVLLSRLSLFIWLTASVGLSLSEPLRGGHPHSGLLGGDKRRHRSSSFPPVSQLAASLRWEPSHNPLSTAFRASAGKDFSARGLFSIGRHLSPATSSAGSFVSLSSLRDRDSPSRPRSATQAPEGLRLSPAECLSSGCTNIWGGRREEVGETARGRKRTPFRQADSQTDEEERGSGRARRDTRRNEASPFSAFVFCGGALWLLMRETHKGTSDATRRIGSLSAHWNRSRRGPRHRFALRSLCPPPSVTCFPPRSDCSCPFASTHPPFSSFISAFASTPSSLGPVPTPRAVSLRLASASPSRLSRPSASLVSSACPSRRSFASPSSPRSSVFYPPRVSPKSSRGLCARKTQFLSSHLPDDERGVREDSEFFGVSLAEDVDFLSSASTASRQRRERDPESAGLSEEEDKPEEELLHAVEPRRTKRGFLIRSRAAKADRRDASSPGGATAPGLWGDAETSLEEEALRRRRERSVRGSSEAEKEAWSHRREEEAAGRFKVGDAAPDVSLPEFYYHNIPLPKGPPDNPEDPLPFPLDFISEEEKQDIRRMPTKEEREADRRDYFGADNVRAYHLYNPHWTPFQGCGVGFRQRFQRYFKKGSTSSLEQTVVSEASVFLQKATTGLRITWRLPRSATSDRVRGGQCVKATCWLGVFLCPFHFPGFHSSALLVSFYLAVQTFLSFLFFLQAQPSVPFGWRVYAAICLAKLPFLLAEYEARVEALLGEEKKLFQEQTLWQQLDRKPEAVADPRPRLPLPHPPFHVWET